MLTLILLLLAAFNLGIMSYILFYVSAVHIGVDLACWLMSRYGIKVNFVDQYGNSRPGWLRGDRAYKLLIKELYSETK